MQDATCSDLQATSPPDCRATSGRGDSSGRLVGRPDYFVRVSISSGLSPPSASTLLVCSPRLATLGPLCTGDPEKRKGGAGDRYLPALSSIGQSDPRWATCGSFSASVTVR